MDPEPRDEESLWRDRASEGDPIALGHIYDAYAQRIYRYLYRRSGDAALAEDLTAEVFLRLWRRAEHPTSAAGHWRHGCTGSLTTGSLTSTGGGASRPYPMTSISLLATMWRQAFIDGELRAAIRKLTPDQQLVVSLKFLEGLSNTEIAAALSKPEGAIKSLQHRALDSLRRLLEADR